MSKPGHLQVSRSPGSSIIPSTGLAGVRLLYLGCLLDAVPAQEHPVAPLVPCHVQGRTIAASIAAPGENRPGYHFEHADILHVIEHKVLVVTGKPVSSLA